MKEIYLEKVSSIGKKQFYQYLMEGNKVTFRWGYLPGKVQEDTRVFTEPKNVGRSNEKSPEQCCLEDTVTRARKKYEKGYSVIKGMDIIEANTGKAVKAANLDVPKPMKAHVLKDHMKKLEGIERVFVQPKLDGCFGPNTMIQTKNGMISIGKIVEGKMCVEVLSYNEETKEFVYNPVTNWFNNGKASSDKWAELTICRGRPFRPTLDQNIYTDKGWAPVSALFNNGYKVLANVSNDYRNSLIAGTLLGDAHLSFDLRGTGSSYRLVFQHTNKALFDTKVEMLGLAGKTREVETGYGSNAWRFVSNALTSSPFPADIFYHGLRGGKKTKRTGKRRIVTAKEMKRVFSRESLAILIADDGSLSYNNDNDFSPVLSIHTQGFPKRQISEIIKYFKDEYMCIPTIIYDKRVNTNGAFLNFKTKDTLYILNKLRKFHVKGVEYKFYFPTEGYVSQVVDKFEYTDYTIKKCRHTKVMPRLDIEVKDTHTFVANGSVVQNCRVLGNSRNGDMYSGSRKKWSDAVHEMLSTKMLEACATIATKVEWPDGELYSPRLIFNDLQTALRRWKNLGKDGTRELLEKVKFYIFDVVAEMGFGKRLEYLDLIVPNDKIVVVKTYIIHPDEIQEYHDKFVDEGYEGVMIRLDVDTSYQQKRSMQIFKHKIFTDEEYEVVGLVPQEHDDTKLGSAVMKHPSGETFNARPAMPDTFKAEIWANQSDYIGRMATVKFQEKDAKSGIPRFPVLTKFRLSEDIS